MLLDAHTHLDHYDEAELALALAEIAALGVLSVAVSMGPASFARVRAIAARSPLVLPCFGVHPWEAHRYVDQLASLEPLIADSSMLGEIGLDYLWDTDPAHYPAQRRVFAHLLQRAADLDLTVNLHTKAAEHDVVTMLDRFAVRRAIVHWYAGPRDAFDALVARGCWFTFGVELPRSPALQDLARAVPAERILTETDGPEGLRWLSGAVGMPRHIAEVLTALAALRGGTVGEIQALVNVNWCRLAAGDARLARWQV